MTQRNESGAVFWLRIDRDSRGDYRWRIHDREGRMVDAAGAGTPTLTGARREAHRRARAGGFIPLGDPADALPGELP